MRYALLAGLVLIGQAHADSPRDLFGIGKDKKVEKASCDDGKTLGCSNALDDFDPVSPYAVRTWLPSSYLLKLPVADARADSVVQLATGASRDEAGPAFGGATGLENRWTIDGAPADNARTGGTIDVQLLRGTPEHEIRAYAWAGVHGEATRRDIAINAYQLRRGFVDAGPDFSASVVGTGPLPSLLGGKTWYAAGIAPALAFTDFEWKAARLVDRDDNGIVDGFPGVIDLEPIETTSERTLDYLVPIMLRTGWDRGPHAIELTLIGHANRDTAMLSLATKQAAGIDREGYVGDAIATWRGSWKRTHARVQAAWHRSVRIESTHDSKAADIPQQLTVFIPNPLPEDPTLSSKCYDRDTTNPIPDEPADDFTKIPNCPIPFGFFASGGAGLLTDSYADRPTVTADVAHRIDHHVLRAGGTFEDSRLVLESAFTGGALVRSLFPGHTDTQRFFDGVCSSFTPTEPETRCEFAAGQTLRYRTRYTAAYAEDTFEPWPRVRVNGGLRWELMWVGTQLHLSREWAPRMGVAWDLADHLGVCEPCNARAWASLGRSFVMLPAGLGPTVIGRNRTARDVSLDLGTPPPITSRTINSGPAFAVAEGIKPAAQDEATVGIEFGLPKILRATLWAQGRTVRRGYETVTFGDSGLAAFDNPGRRPEEAPADRNALTLAFETMIAPSPKMTFRVTYLYNRTEGSWAGPFDPRQGANLYAGEDWDDSTGNIYGRLPTDAGHRVGFELERHGKVSTVEWLAAARLTTQSGRPRSVLGDADGGTVYLLQRGTAGRGELVSQVNVRAGARWRNVDVTLDVFNLFDRRTPTNLDEVYTTGDVAPIVGGSDEDLVWLKTGDGDPVRRRTAYRLPFSYQPPIAATLGIRATF